MLAGVAALPAAAVAHHQTFGSRPLEQGMRGRDVRVLQDFLTRAGFGTSVDGYFGPRTGRRVRAWERSDRRPADGRVSTDDASALRGRVESMGAGTTQPQFAPAERATIASDGTAVAPASAPEPVKRVIAAANEIHDKPYKYGGGHGRWRDRGYDCSGSISYALHGAGLLDRALDSGELMSFGKAGRGRWMTIYAHGGHAYLVVAGLRFDTSGRRERGSRWTTERRSSRGYRARHVDGL